MAKTLCYKPEGRWFQILLHNALGFTQPLTEMSIRSRKIMFVRSRARSVSRPDNLTAISEPNVLKMWDP
jgi:hypothetical protein